MVSLYVMFFFFNIRRPPESKRPYTLCPDEPLFRSLRAAACLVAAGVGWDGPVMHDMVIRDDIADVLKISLLVVSAVALGFAWTFMRERGLYKGELPIL